MIRQFEKLSNEEREILFLAPVLVSVLASSSYNEVNAARKADAIKLAHLRTFTSPYSLRPYYVEVEKTFKEQFEEAVKKYYPFDEEKQTALKNELETATLILSKLDKDYARGLYESLEGYSKHVKRADHSVFEDFIFPVPIRGLIE